jgi:hypothetical protein
MGQRLIKERQRRILGILSNGIRVYPITGAEDPPPADGGQNSTGGDDAGSGGEGDGASGPKSTYTAEEFEALRRRMQAADRKASAAESKLAELDKAKLGEKERAERERDEARQASEALADKLRDQSRKIAFLSSNKYTWHDPESALLLVDMSDVEIDDDGKVTGMEAAIERLAKSKPFLLKAKEEPKKEEKEKPKGPSGSSPTPKADGNGKGDRRAVLEAKYPALGGRVQLPIG